MSEEAIVIVCTIALLACVAFLITRAIWGG